MTIPDLWNHFIQSKAFWFASYSIVVTIILAAIIYKHHIKRLKYNKWKDTISIPYIWKREYEPHHDDMFEKLWDENEKHKVEIVLLKRSIKKLNLRMFLISVLVYFYFGLKYYLWHKQMSKFKKKKPIDKGHSPKSILVDTPESTENISKFRKMVLEANEANNSSNEES